MQFTKNGLVNPKEILRNNQDSFSIKLLRALEVVVFLNVGELLRKALLVVVVLIIPGSVVDEPVGHDYPIEAALLAGGKPSEFLPPTFMQTEVVLLVH